MQLQRILNDADVYLYKETEAENAGKRDKHIKV